MGDFIVEHILPIFLVILLTMVTIIIGMFIFRLANEEIYITRVIMSKNYISNSQANVYRIGE